MPDFQNRLNAQQLIDHLGRTAGAAWNELWPQQLRAADREHLATVFRRWEADETRAKAKALIVSRSGDPAENIEEAIRIVTELIARIAPALLENLSGELNTVTIMAILPPGIGDLFDVLGLAYRRRINGEPGRNREIAYNAYVTALGATPPEPVDTYAAALANLASALQERVYGSLRENHQRALDLLQRAVDLLTPERHGPQRAATLSNLANLWLTGDVGSRGANVEKAIRLYRESLRARPRESDPQGRAVTAMNLASAFLERESGNDKANVEKALCLVKEALRFRPRERMPDMWADTMAVLGLCYARRTRGDHVANLNAALRAFADAAEIMRSDKDRQRSLMLARHKAEVLFRESLVQEAEEAYAKAINLGAAAMDDDFLAGRRVAVGGLHGLGAPYALIALERGDLGTALERLDAGKTRMFRLAALRERAAKASQAQIRELERQRAAERRRDRFSTRLDDAVFVEALHEAHARLADELKGELQGMDHLAAKDILTLAPEGGALVAPLFTSRVSAVFVIPSGATEVSPSFVHRLEDVTLEQVARLRLPTDPGTNTEGLLDLTHRIWKLVGERILKALNDVKARRVVVLPQAGIATALLHASWREVAGGRRTFGDEFEEVRYAPSAFSLWRARETLATVGSGPPLVAGISNYRYRNPLRYAALEAAIVARELGTEALPEDVAKVEMVLERAGEAPYIHLACHGAVPPSEPLEAALMLAGDERLTLATVFRRLTLHRTARLVTLSACEVGQSGSSAPDEFVGFPTGFLEAGASGVLGALWPIDDLSTTLLMSRFYQLHLGEKLAPGVALARAQRWLRELTPAEAAAAFDGWGHPEAVEELQAMGAPGEKCFADPCLWAGFSYFGA